MECVQSEYRDNTIVHYSQVEDKAGAYWYNTQTISVLYRVRFIRSASDLTVHSIWGKLHQPNSNQVLHVLFETAALQLTNF